MATRTIRRSVLGGLVAWALTLGGLRAIVVQPEHCASGTRNDIRIAAELAVGWIANNQRDDGTYLYRYDRDTNEDLGGYNIVRHAGVTMSLEQAAALGILGASEAADAGLAWALEHVYRGPGWEALSDPDSSVKVGATGLLVAALAQRRQRTGDQRYDELLHRLGTFMTAMVNERGQVLGTWDTETEAPVPGSWSPYFTGEVFWALAQLHREFPGDGFDTTAAQIANYLATERDDVEGWWPDIADHWAAYGFAEMASWPGGYDFSREQIDYMRRQAGFQSLQIRYESQRTNTWFSHVTRGRKTLGAGMGVIGEALDQWSAVAGATPALHDMRSALDERAQCAANVLADRQVGPSDLGDDDSPAARASTLGAWFQFGVTQMDDQQHSLSALLGALASATGVSTT